LLVAEAGVLLLDQRGGGEEAPTAVVDRCVDAGDNRIMSGLHQPCWPGNQRNSPQDGKRLAGNRAMHFPDALRGFLHRGPGHMAVTCFDRPGAGGVLALRHGWSSESDDEKGGPRGLQAPGTFRDSGREEAAVQADTWVVTLIRHRGSAYSNGGAGFPDYLAQGLTQMGVPGAAASPRAGDARQWQRRPLIPAWRVRRSLLDQALRHQVRAGSCRPDKPAPGA
jgi:hypothetical protein